MPLTVEQIVEETRSLSEDQLVLLVHRLHGRLHDIDPQIEEAWQIETRRRIEEIGIQRDRYLVVEGACRVGAARAGSRAS